MVQNSINYDDGKTQESLLKSSRNSSDTVNNSDIGDSPISCCYSEAKKSTYAGWCYLCLILISLLWAIATLIWTPYQLLMEERLRMRPGLPPFDWWQDPPPMVHFRVYVFNVTNSEEFLKNNSIKLNVEEIGPIVYSEILTHSNIKFNENGTLTYVATRKAVFLPELNTIDLNSTVIVPNWAVLGIASFLWEQSYFMKLGYNLLMRSIKPDIFVEISIHDLLWNFTDPFLHASRGIAPHLVPTTNMGILSKIYTKFENTVNVYIGNKWGNERFFLIDRYDGSEKLPLWGNKCNDKVVNSTEGILYPQFIQKDTKLYYWRRTLCKTAELIYTHNFTKSGINVYHFTLPSYAYNRTKPEENDCFKMSPPLLDGLTDVSKCHFDFPIAASFPHFLFGDEALKTYVTGLKPDFDKHTSYVDVEPTTGVPLSSRAASQCNLIVRNLKGFHEAAARFSDTIIPMFWIEYYQIGLPWYMTALIYVTTNILPIFQRFFTAFLLISAAIFLHLHQKTKRRKQLLVNKILIFEKERDNLLNNKV